MQFQPGRAILGNDQTIYDLLRFLPPGLMLDVGAAAGFTTRSMLANSPKSEILAYEPFTDNHEFFYETIGDDPRVRLFPYGVGECSSNGWFRLGRTVQGTEPGWERMRGYSSLGYLAEAPKGRESDYIQVRTVTIDEIVGSRHVRFMKVDIQGGELGLLKGASCALSQGRIDVMFMEFTGQEAVLGYLLQFPVSIFDSHYMIVPKHMIVPKPNDAKFDTALSNWIVLETGFLSTGQVRHICRPLSVPQSPSAYIEFFEAQRSNFQFIQTDLVVVSAQSLAEFRDAVSKASQTLKEGSD